MSADMLSLDRSFPNFNPGQFRTIMTKAEIITQTEDTVLLHQGIQPAQLFLTISDGFMLERNSQNAELGPGNFLGEISFLLGGAATATVVAKPGSSYVSWDLGELHYMMANSPSMANAVSVLLNKDIARKLAVSFPTTLANYPETVT
jgi:CRP-like cAMP-binding protein